MKQNIRLWSELPLSLDLATVAAVFGVSDRTVRNWVHDGWLDACAIGGTIRFDRDYIHDLLRNGPQMERKGNDNAV